MIAIKQVLYKDFIETPPGVFLILFHQRAIYEICFPGGYREYSCSLKGLPWPGLAADLNLYFQGEDIRWVKYPLDRGGYSPFTLKVLETVRQIPYGETRSYREVAELCGSPRGARAVGQAVKSNRHPVLVPCHRV
ncbi:MAG TPA: MGMT family protein, partial [Firmicutes bacterium]|nr:MGMT family protein [Bacillota bacterium]